MARFRHSRLGAFLVYGFPPGVSLAYLLSVWLGIGNLYVYSFVEALILALWVSLTTGFTRIALRQSSRHKHFARLLALVPAVSYLAFSIVYASAFIGTLGWGRPMTLSLFLSFVPDIFNLASALSVPRFLVLAMLIVPPVLLVSVFQYVVWSHQLESGPSDATVRQKPRWRTPFWKALGVFAWLFVAFWLNIMSDDAGIAFQNPAIEFFCEKRVLPPSPERQYWAKQDVIARQALPRNQVPAVKTVVLFIVDCLRADRLSLYGYQDSADPFIKDFQRSPGFQKIALALSNGDESRGGILSVLTSKNVFAISHMNYSLTDCLVDQGFKAWMFLSGNHTSWYGLHTCYGMQVDRYVDGATVPGPHGVNDDEMLVQQVERLPQNDGSFHFFYFHLMSVHETGYLSDEFRLNGRSNHGPDRNTRAIEYDQRIAQADSIIRRLMTELKKKGYLNDYVGVLTGDHGELLGEKGRYGHGRAMSLPGIHIPMVFFGSKELPRFKQADFGVQIDIAPTLLDIVGLKIPSTWHGSSLLRDSVTPWSYHVGTWNRGEQHGAVVYRDSTRILKYSFGTQQGAKDRDEIYDIVRDPQENENLLSGGQVDESLQEEMRRRAKDFVLNRQL